MKKLIMVLVVMTMLVGSNIAYARELNEQEMSYILDGRYTVCESAPGYIDVGYENWSRKDLFGNSYRKFTVRKNGKIQTVLIKYNANVDRKVETYAVEN